MPSANQWVAKGGGCLTQGGGPTPSEPATDDMHLILLGLHSHWYGFGAD